jgi:short-subunit dehydrogenase
MAELGFNICIVGRTISKITATLDEIQKKYKIKTRSVVFDFE